MRVPKSSGWFCCYIVPPYLMRQLASYGTSVQREAAFRALRLDSATRSERALTSSSLLRPKRGLLEPKPSCKVRMILSAEYQEQTTGTVLRTEEQPSTGEPAVDQAYDGLGATFDFFNEVYHRNSIDDHGLLLKGVVHYGNGYNNAFWDGQQMVFGDGDGVIFHGFTSCLDVIGHELTHGIVGVEADLLYLRQPGALNESLADVFGSLVKQYHLKQTVDMADWLIGKGLFVKDQSAALRSLKAPGTAYDFEGIGKDPQPSQFENYVETMEDNGGVHVNSGIPNHAFYLAALSIGGYAFEQAGQIWYQALRDPQLQKNADFIDFAALTALNSVRLFGASSVETKAVVHAWRSVGIPVETSPTLSKVF